MKGISVTTKDFQKIQFHLLLSSYAAGLPDTEDLLSLKRASQAAFLFHVCLADKQSIPLLKRTASRTLKHTKSLLANENGTSRQHDLEIRVNLLFVNPIPPVLSSFFFARIHSSVIHMQYSD